MKELYLLVCELLPGSTLLAWVQSTSELAEVEDLDDHSSTEWYQSARCLGVDPEVAELGRDVIRASDSQELPEDLRDSDHRSLLLDPGSDHRPLLLWLAVNNPDLARHRWMQFLSAEPLWGDWKRKALSQLEFGRGLLKQAFVDAHHVVGRGLQRASRGQVVDRARQTAREIVDQLLHRRVKNILGTACLLHLNVDVAARLFLGERLQPVVHADTVEQVAMLRSLECRAQRLLPHEQDLQRRSHIHRRAD